MLGLSCVCFFWIFKEWRWGFFNVLEGFSLWILKYLWFFWLGCGELMLLFLGRLSMVGINVLMEYLFWIFFFWLVLLSFLLLLEVVESLFNNVVRLREWDFVMVFCWDEVRSFVLFVFFIFVVGAFRYGNKKFGCFRSWFIILLVLGLLYGL